MSFTGSVKEEVINLNSSDLESRACLSAIIHNVGSITNDSIKVVTENSLLAKYIDTLLRDIYDITPKIIVRKGFFKTIDGIFSDDLYTEGEVRQLVNLIREKTLRK